MAGGAAVAIKEDRMPKTKKPQKTETVVMYYYIRPGHFMPGLPAKDLTEAEWNTYPADLRDAALANDLYQRTEEALVTEPDDEPLADEGDDGRTDPAE